MQFPEAPHVIYDKNPLIGVTCQFSFPDILLINKEQPAAFQERIRQQYPTFSVTSDIKLPPQIGNLPSPIGLGNPRYEFEDDADEPVWSIRLTQSTLALSTTSYSRWEEFSKRLDHPLKAFIETYSPAFFTRIGLRYQNLIVRSELGIVDTPWKQLLNPYIAGFLAVTEDEDEVELSQTRTVVVVNHTHKVLLQHGLITRAEDSQYCYLIDNDFFTDKRTEVSHAGQQLDALHDGSGRVFKWCITDYLHEALEPLEPGPIQQC